MDSASTTVRPPGCQSFIPPLSKPGVVVGPTGFPEVLRLRCRQTVGVARWLDAAGQERAACTLPGHRADVERQEAVDRAIRDHDEDVRAALAERAARANETSAVIARLMDGDR